MGISETLFLKIFPPVFGSALLLPAMVLSRGLGYYGELLVSAVFTIVAQSGKSKTKNRPVKVSPRCKKNAADGRCKADIC